MATFHDRYQAGEHEQVWSELLGLGEAVRSEPVYQDAVAVARGTMRRAQSNIETLIGRLDSLGYKFETEQSVAQQSMGRIASLAGQMDALRTAAASSPAAQHLKVLFDRIASLPALAQHHTAGIKAAAAKPAPHPLEDPYVYGRATRQSAQEIANAEQRLGGPLPISLKAWYETIGSVSLMGSHPDLNPTGHAHAKPMMYVNPSMLAGPGGERRRQLAESLGFRPTTQAQVPSLDEDALPDPLVIFPLADLLGDREEDEEGPVDSFFISPDDLHKAHISGDAYYVDLPDRKADVIFQDWKNGYFVPYLRRVFAWGGFPGWERHRNPPTRLMRELASGLLPL